MKSVHVIRVRNRGKAAVGKAPAGKSATVRSAVIKPAVVRPSPAVQVLVSVALVAAASVIGLVGMGTLSGVQPGAGVPTSELASSSDPSSTYGSARASAAAELHCRFIAGDTAAFTLTSIVKDTRFQDRDFFRAILSWRVLPQIVPDRWRLLAQLSGVSHDQSLTLTSERVQGSLEEPFVVEIDRRCRVRALGFVRAWDVGRRQFVRTLLATHEFAMPDKTGAAHWRSEQADGIGTFVARYDVRAGAPAPLVFVDRRKRRYRGLRTHVNASGITVEVVESAARATFDRERPHWLHSSRGREHVRVRLQGAVEADLVQHFSLMRDDALYMEPSPVDVGALDFRDAFALI